MYKALADAIKDAEREKKSLAQIALEAESRDQGRPIGEIRAVLKRALDVMRNINLEKAHQVLRDAFRPARRTSVNAFLIHSKGRIAIVDTGSGNYLLPTAGFVQRNLVAAGIDPKSIDTVLLTHMHPDHSAGLTDEERTEAWRTITRRASSVAVLESAPKNHAYLEELPKGFVPDRRFTRS